MSWVRSHCVVPFAFAAALLLVAIAAPMSLALDEDDQQFLSELRQRRLFRLSADWLTRQLQSQDITAQSRAELTAELIRVQAARAAQSAPDGNRAALWAVARKTAADYLLATNADDGARLLVAVQDALTPLARGELLRHEWEAGVGDGATRDDALASIRDAVKRLGEVEKELKKQIAAGRDDGGLTAEQRISLVFNVRFQQARAMKNRALCYRSEDASRIDALQQALTQLDALLREIAADDALASPAHLERARCLRLLGRIDEATAEIKSITDADPPISVRLQATAETARLFLSASRLDQAEASLSKQIEAIGESPEFDFALLQTYVAQWRAAAAKNDAAKRDAYRTKAKAAVAMIETQHGPYWRRRADRVLIEAAGETGASGDYEILLRTADRLYQRGEFNEAVAAYASAGDQLVAAGDVDQAFSMYYKAALVEHQRKRHPQAAARFALAAAKSPQHELASKAQLLAAYNYSRVAGENPAAIEIYAATLEELLATWPQSPSADTARLWLGKLRSSQKSWGEAIDLLLAISPSSNEYAEGITVASKTARSWLNDLTANQKPTETTAENVATKFDEAFAAGGGAKEGWNGVNRLAVLTAASLRVRYQTGDRKASIERLETALTESPDADAAWKSQARTVLVVGLASTTGRTGDAQPYLAKLATQSPTELMEMLQVLSQQGKFLPEGAQRQLASLQLTAVGLLNPKTSQLTKQQQMTLRMVEANALQQAGRRTEAKTVFEALAKANLRDGAIQQSYAEFLAQSQDRTELNAALSQWRRVAAGSRPKTDSWWRAKYQIALTQFRLGEKQEAANLIRYLQATPPGLASSPLREQFEALLKRSTSE